MHGLGVLFLSLLPILGGLNAHSGITAVDGHTPLHGTTPRSSRATWPVAGVPVGRQLDTVLEPFVRPACRWCPGRRGVWVEVPTGSFQADAVAGVPIVAPWPGTVTFAGLVVDRLYVTVRLAGGAHVTCGGLSGIDLAVVVGSPVSAGQVLGVAAERLFLSVRLAGVHIEPLTSLGFARPRLTAQAAVGPLAGAR